MPTLRQLNHRALFTLIGQPTIIYSKIDPIMEHCCDIKYDAEREDTHTYVLIGLDTEVKKIEVDERL